METLPCAVKVCIFGCDQQEKSYDLEVKGGADTTMAKSISSSRLHLGIHLEDFALSQTQRTLPERGRIIRLTRDSHKRKWASRQRCLRA